MIVATASMMVCSAGVPGGSWKTAGSPLRTSQWCLKIRRRPRFHLAQRRIRGDGEARAGRGRRCLPRRHHRRQRRGDPRQHYQPKDKRHDHPLAHGALLRAWIVAPCSMSARRCPSRSAGTLNGEIARNRTPLGGEALEENRGRAAHALCETWRSVSAARPRVDLTISTGWGDLRRYGIGTDL